MKPYNLTYNEALELVDFYNNNQFYKTETIIDSFKVVTFNYFLCDYSIFSNPLKDKPYINAFDMRGLTFIFNENGSLFRKYSMLSKFFNIGQVEETQLNILKLKEIDSVHTKEDGSLIGFMKLPSGKLMCKTNGGFNNEQSIRAMELVDNNKALKDYILEATEIGTPLFEYVSFDNQIVLKYNQRELKYLGLRTFVGPFIPASKLGINLDIVKCAENINLSLDELLERSKILEGIEGWVIQFTDGTMVKLKTEWYFIVHKIRTEHISREDYVIHSYLNLSLDDAISQLDPISDSEAISFVNKVTKCVDLYLEKLDKNVETLIEKYRVEYNSNWNEFAKNNHSIEGFSLIKSKLENDEFYKKKKIELLMKKTSTLKMAKNFIDSFKQK